MATTLRRRRRKSPWIRSAKCMLRCACWTPPPKDEARYGMEYTIRFAFKRDGEIAAPPRRTYSSHDVPDEVRDTYREAVDEALKPLNNISDSLAIISTRSAVRRLWSAKRRGSSSK